MINKKAILFILVFGIFFVAGLFFTDGKHESPKRVKQIIPAMGTIVEIQLPEGDEKANADAFKAAFDEVRRIESLFTDYNDSSAIGSFNEIDSGLAKVDPEVISLVKKAIELSDKTEGAFDITLGNIMRLWGFKDASMHLPAKDSVMIALKESGIDNIKLIGDSLIVKKNRVHLDLSGIAKGYAVDRAFAILEKIQVPNFLINAGGEIRAKGEGWKTGVQNPFNENEVVEIVYPGKMALATSGDYENFFEVDGKKYCHLFDPKTGFPASEVSSVTIIAGDVTTADALATALFVLGLEKSKELIKKFPGCEYLIIDKNGKKHYSTGFKDYTRS